VGSMRGWMGGGDDVTRECGSSKSNSEAVGPEYVGGFDGAVVCDRGSTAFDALPVVADAADVDAPERK
jgi:hypothetical protein